MEGEPPEEEEGQRDEVGDLDADESSSKVVAENGLIFALEEVGGEGEGENHPGDHEEDLDAKVSLRDEEVGEVGEDGEPTRFREGGGGDGFLAGAEEVVCVEEDDEDNSEAAEPVDFRNIATRRSDAGEGSEDFLRRSSLGHLARGADLTFGGKVGGVQGFLDLGVDLVLEGFGGHTKSILDGQGRGSAVGDDDDAIHSEEGAAAVGFVVGAILDGLEGALAHEGSGDADGVLLELLLHPLGHRLGGRLAAFQDDVSGEAVAKTDIEPGLEEIVSFHIAAEGERGVSSVDEVLEENHRLLGEGSAFFFFLAIRHDADMGIGNFENLTGVNTAHDGIGHKMSWLGLGVRSGVEKITNSELVGHGGGDSGAGHSFKKAKLHGGGGDGGSGIASGDEGLGSAFLDEISRDGDGGVFLFPQSLGS